MSDDELKLLAELKAKKLNKDMDDLKEGNILTIKFTKDNSYRYKLRFVVIDGVDC